MSKSQARLSAVPTQRLIGIEHAKNGRFVAIAMVETDGGNRIRRFHSSVTPLRSNDTAKNVAHVVELVTEYLGNLMLQPFAIDSVGVSGPVARHIGDALALHLDLQVVIVQEMEAVGPSTGRLSTSERIALAAVLLA